MADYKITISNKEEKIRAGQSEFKIKIENLTSDKKRVALVFVPAISESKGYVSDPKTVELGANSATNGEHTKEVTFKLPATEITDDYSGATIEIGISDGKKAPQIQIVKNQKQVLWTGQLHPSTGDSRLEHIYWSSVEEINDITKKESERTDFCKNEDGFLHIKTLGLYNSPVILKLTCTVNGEVKTLCEDYPVSLNKNKKTVSVYATEVLDYIKRIYDKETISVITATVTHGTTTKTATLNLKCTESAAKPAESVYQIGRVLVEVGEENSDASDIKPENLLIGCIGKIEGVGKRSKSVSVYEMRLFNIYVFDFIRLNTITKDDVKDFTNNVADRKKIRKLILDKIAESNGDLKYGELENILEEAIKRRRPFWTREVCRDAWYEIDYRLDNNRYGKDQECPPGPHYIVAYAGSRYVNYLTRKIDGNGINQGVKRNGEKFSVSPSRDGIAIHKGTSNGSQGCITLNGDLTAEKDMFDRLFTGKKGLYSPAIKKVNQNYLQTGLRKADDHSSRLRMLILEERGVDGETPVKRVSDLKKGVDSGINNDTKYDLRHYHHVRPSSIPNITIREVKLEITYTEKSTKDGKTVEETKKRIDTPLTSKVVAGGGAKPAKQTVKVGDKLSLTVVETSYMEELIEDDKKKIQWYKKSSLLGNGLNIDYTVAEADEGKEIDIRVRHKVQSDCFIFEFSVEKTPAATTTAETSKKT